MSIRLNPVTQEKLDQFGRRRRRLIVARGVCAAAASFLLLMSVVALADWLWVLSDTVRWALSGLGYAGAAVLVWWTCLRLMVRLPSQRELAQRIETAEPGLRENLLSAIELCADDAGEMRDSPVFRQLVQERVGRQMLDVNVSSLLPLKLLGRWMLAAVLIVIVFVSLLSLPGWPFQILLTRAILPGANIARVSRIHVTILQPTPHSLTLPQDETVAVVAEITEGVVDEVTLETQTEGNGVTRQLMQARSLSQFVSNLSLGADSIAYRILAGDAVTQWHTIETRPRPGVQAFHKTFRFPEYSGLENKNVTEPHGDLIALEGTEADLVLDLDQEVTEAEIRLERFGSEQIETVDLTPDEAGRLHVTLPVTDAAVYKVHLVSKETGFENTFSPKYEIRPEPDLIPRVGFVDLQDSTLLLPPNDILALQGLAEDDLPLVGLEQHVSVNGRAWQAIPFEVEQKRRVTTEWDWDLLPLNLKSGDQVTTKLVATDRKGNTGESVPLHIVVSSPDFDPDRHAVMELKGRLYDKLVAMSDAISQHRDAAKNLIERVPQDGHATVLPEADLATLRDLGHKVRDEADSVFGQIVEILPRMPAGADAYELELVGRVVARIRHEYASVPNVALTASTQHEDTDKPNEELQRLQKAFDQSADDALSLKERYRDLLIHNVLAAVALDMDALLQHQRQLLAPGTPQSWQRLLRQETVAINQIRVVERLIRENMPRLSSSTQSGLLRQIDWLRARRGQLTESTESEEQLASLQRAAETLTRELEGHQSVDTLDWRLPSNLVAARKDLDQRSGSLFRPIERLASSTSEANRLTVQAAESDDSEKSREALLAAERTTTELQQLHVPSLSQFNARRTVTQTRTDSDSQYASDAGLTRRAVVGLLDRYAAELAGESEVPEILAKIAPAYRTLESGHETVQTVAALANLLSLERWDSQGITSRLDHPRQWDAVNNGLENAARKLREANFPNEIVSRVDSLRRSTAAQDAEEKITARRRRHDRMVSAAYELAELKTELDTVLEEIKPIMAEARALIAQYVPSIPQMAEQAAKELRELEQQTTELAEKPPAADEAGVSPRMETLQERQQQANQQIHDLMEALAEDANSQDLLTDEGRERARDADDSMAMIREPAARMKQAMQKAATAEEAKEQARDLAQAAEHQEQTADAMDRIAEHFERLDAGEDVAQTRNALRQAEREMGIARQMDQQYGRAQQLGEMAAKDPQQLLAELEAELQQNPTMQEALSEIARDALQQAKNSLEHSADQEESMRRDMERSDPQFRAKKEPLVQELKEIAREASDLGRTLVAQADSAASRAQTEQVRERLQAAQQNLAEVADRPKDIRNESVLKKMVEAARDMADELGDASKSLAESRDAAAKAKNESIHSNEQQRAARQRELEKQQRQLLEHRIRAAKGQVRDRDKSEKRAADRVKAAERSVDKAQKQTDEARKSLGRSPENESAKQSVVQAEAKQEDAQAALQKARDQLEQAQQQAEHAEQTLQQLQQKKLPSLTAPNPSAELAHRLAEEATGIAEELTRRAKRLAETPEWWKELKPSPEQLAQAVTQQQDVGEDVSQAADDIARASRHEQRLGKPSTSEQMNKTAADVQEVADDEVEVSEHKLSDAANEASAAEETDARDNSQALAAHVSVEEAQMALSKQAEAIGEILNPSAQSEAAPDEALAESDQAVPSAASQPKPTQPSPAEAEQGRLLARTLDELDRAVAEAQDSAAPTAVPPRQSLPSLAQAAQAQSAMMTQMRMPNPPSHEGAIVSGDGANLTDEDLAKLSLMPVNRQDGEEWGQLRAKSAEDLTEGRKESVSAEYRQRVQTYFRVLAERARKKK